MLFTTSIKNLTSTLLLVLLGGTQANAETRFQIKCHVELVGGGDAIYFASIPHTDLAKATKELQGKVVPLAGFVNTRQIYKVSECVELDDRFTQGRAQKVDANTPR